MRRTVLTEVHGQRPRHLMGLHLAALKGHTGIVNLLVRLGVRVNTVNNKKDTPLLWSTRFNHIDTARQLLTLGADVSLQNDKGMLLEETCG